MNFKTIDFNKNVVVINHEYVNASLSTTADTEEELEMVVAQVIKNCCMNIGFDCVEKHPTSLLNLMAVINKKTEQIVKEAKVTVLKPSLASLKDFVDALADTLEDGNMSHIKEYEDKYSKLPVQLEDYIWRKVNE